MTDRPIVALEQGGSLNGLDRLLDLLATLLATEPDDGLAQVEEVLRGDYGLSLVHLGPSESLPPHLAHAAYVRLRAANDVVICAWPPERLVEPPIRTALHLVSRVVPRLHRAPVPSAVSAGGCMEVGRLLGRSVAMRQLHERIARVARRSFGVLIEGESGVGKELVARAVHALGDRQHGPFIAVNCAAIVETLLEAELFGIEERTATGVRGRRGKFEAADGGTLFLDEVSDLSLGAQAKVLRAIQDLTVERVGSHGSRHVDVRIIAATNQSLRGAVANGTFRQDLFYRLNAVEISVPPLRARREDIPVLAAALLERYRVGRPYRLSPAAADALLVYEWPGNVRELERVLERAVTLDTSEVIQLDDLPDALLGKYREVMVRPADQSDDSMRAWGSRYARLVLERANGNKREACRILDISYHTLKAYLAYSGPRTRRGPSPRAAVDGGATRRRPGTRRYAVREGHGASVVHDAPWPDDPK